MVERETELKKMIAAVNTGSPVSCDRCCADLWLRRRVLCSVSGSVVSVSGNVQGRSGDNTARVAADDGVEDEDG